jgi:uncharacterized protein YyaL (SSP411 family)
LDRLPPDGGVHWNRLVFEKSPYLQQHAANQVDWYPWGEEAFTAAREADRPIFLSIGYSTCHWCHVMERESFEDEQVAALLNGDFVAVKVDREERPDIDRIYMAVTQGLTGSGGWPMTVVMTPDARPFFAGTYFPRESRHGRPGMLDLLPQLAAAWRDEREKVVASAREITDWLARSSQSYPGESLDEQTLEAAYRQLADRFDDSTGGFGAQPKFPTPHNLTFLLRYWRRTGEERALEMVERTLRAMRSGGICDQIGFGFHRYSTDRQWLVPHFEKMLYDQALLSIAFLETFQATGDAFFADSARETYQYVLRDLTDPAGGFYSAEDADSEGVEGKFYLWTESQVRAVLGDDSDRFLRTFGFEPEGNYVEESTRRRTGENIPFLPRPMSALAAEQGVSEAEFTRRLEANRRRLFQARKGRTHPFKDDKILTDWNGLMIAALAIGGRVLGEPEFSEAGARAAGFLWENCRDAEGKLLKRYRHGDAGLPGHIDDYAFLTWGMIELYQATFEVSHIERALLLQEETIQRFWDADRGGFFFTASDGEDLLVRNKEIYDGAIPSGNSVACLNLLRLGRLTARPEWEMMAEKMLECFAGRAATAPSAHAHLMAALDFISGPTSEIVIAGEPGTDEVQAMLGVLRSVYLPNSVFVLRPEPGEDHPIAELAPFTREYRSIGGQATAYVCSDYVCRLPTSDPDEMLSLLANPKK